MPINPNFASLYDLKAENPNDIFGLRKLFGMKESFSPGEDPTLFKNIEAGILHGTYKDDEIADFARRNPEAAPFLQQAIQKRNIYRQNFQPAVAPDPFLAGAYREHQKSTQVANPDAELPQWDQERLTTAEQGKKQVDNIEGAVNQLRAAGMVDEANKLIQGSSREQPKETSLRYAKVAEGFHPDTPLNAIPPEKASRILARTTSPVAVTTPLGVHLYGRGGVPGEPNQVPGFIPRIERAPEKAKDALIHNQAQLTKVRHLLSATDPKTTKEERKKLSEEGIKYDPEATGFKGLLPDFILNRVDPQGVSVRAILADIGSMKIRDRSGAAVTAAEFPRLRPFIPNERDNAQTVRDKIIGFYRELAEVDKAIRSGYTFDQGFIPLPGEEKKPATKPSNRPGLTPGEQRELDLLRRKQR